MNTSTFVVNIAFTSSQSIVDYDEIEKKLTDFFSNYTIISLFHVMPLSIVNNMTVNQETFTISQHSMTVIYNVNTILLQCFYGDAFIAFRKDLQDFANKLVKSYQSYGDAKIDTVVKKVLD